MKTPTKDQVGRLVKGWEIAAAMLSSFKNAAFKREMDRSLVYEPRDDLSDTALLVAAILSVVRLTDKDDRSVTSRSFREVSPQTEIAIAAIDKINDRKPDLKKVRDKWIAHLDGKWQPSASDLGDAVELCTEILYHIAVIIGVLTGKTPVEDPPYPGRVGRLHWFSPIHDAIAFTLEVDRRLPEIAAPAFDLVLPTPEEMVAREEEKAAKR